MHEYSIVQALLERVEESLGGYDVKGVRALRVRIGELSGVDAGLLRTAYELCVPGTLCATADLQIEPVPVLWQCPRCGRGAAPGARLSCAECGVSLRLVQGDEITLETIDVEVEHV